MIASLWLPLTRPVGPVIVECTSLDLFLRCSLMVIFMDYIFKPIAVVSVYDLLSLITILLAIPVPGVLVSTGTLVLYQGPGFTHRF